MGETLYIEYGATSNTIIVTQKNPGEEGNLAVATSMAKGSWDGVALHGGSDAFAAYPCFFDRINKKLVFLNAPLKTKVEVDILLIGC